MSAAALPRRRIGPFEVMAMGLGAMNLSHGYGPPVPEADAARLLLEALDLGVDFVDTASLYGYGANESLVGRVLGPHRSRFVLASKCGMTGQPVGPAGALQRVIDGRPEAIRRDCEASLRRLGTDYVDLYQIHRWDYATPIEETMEALHDVVKAGKARYIGASSMYAWQFAKALHVAERNGWTRFVSMQDHYNLLNREEEREMHPLCADERIGVIPWSPLARGRLTRDWDEQTERSRTDDLFGPLYAGTVESDRRVVEQVAAVAAGRGVARAQVALAWMLSKPVISAPIIGATRMEHLEDAVAALSLQLEPAEIAALEAPYVPHPVAGFQ